MQLPEYFNIFLNPHYKHIDSDADSFVGSELFTTFINHIDTLINYPRTREHLLLYRAIALKNDYSWETIDVEGSKMFIFKTLCLLNYTMSDEHKNKISPRSGSYVLFNHNNFPLNKIVSLYPNVLLQPIRRNALQGPKWLNQRFNYDLPDLIKLTPQNIKPFINFLKSFKKEASMAMFATTFARCYESPFRKNLSDACPELLNAEFMINFVFSEKEQYYVHDSFLRLWWATKHPKEFIKNSLKVAPQLEVFNFVLKEEWVQNNISDAIHIFLMATRKEIGIKYKLSSFRPEKEFLLENFGFNSSRLSNFIKNPPPEEVISHRMFFENVLTLGLMIKALNLTHNHAWKLLNLAKEKFEFYRLVEDYDLVDYISFINFMTDDQKVRFLYNSIAATKKKNFHMQDFLYEDSSSLNDYKSFFDDFFKTLPFNEYNNAQKLHYIVTREVNRLNQPEYCFYNPSFLATELIPKQIDGLDVELAKTSEDLILWGYTLKNCLGSYVSEGRRDLKPLILSFKKDGKLMYALEISLDYISNVYNQLDKIRHAERDESEVSRAKTYLTRMITKSQNMRFFSLEEFKGEFNSLPEIEESVVAEALDPFFKESSRRFMELAEEFNDQYGEKLPEIREKPPEPKSEKMKIPDTPSTEGEKSTIQSLQVKISAFFRISNN